MKKLLMPGIFFIFNFFVLPSYCTEAQTFCPLDQTVELKGKLNESDYLTYEELLKLSDQSEPEYELYAKLEKQLSTPYIVNRTESILQESFNKSHIRLAHWNIERGFNIDAIGDIILNSSEFFEKNKKNICYELHEHLSDELQILSSSDVISLNEVDIGMPRTSYVNVVHKLAERLGYNYVFAPEFIELGPLRSMLEIDPNRYFGLHGNAIISKYPITSARVIKLPECYKWFKSEVKKKSPLEHLRRIGAKGVFDETILTEVRHGDRNALVAEIKLPNSEIITVVSTHLEDRCYPSCRLKQVKNLLSKLKDEKNPLVLTGDLNTSTTDTAPTSVTKEIAKRIKDIHFVARQGALLAIPLPPGVGNIASFLVSKLIQYKDPAVPSFPVLFPNHERRLFKFLRAFSFSDNEKFDFSGDKDKSSNGRKGLLANSNERHFKGFTSTFKFEEPRLIAYYKLDWFFVKPKGDKFKPFNGRTLKLVNKAYPGRVSDHDPITVDITLDNQHDVLAVH